MIKNNLNDGRLHTGIDRLNVYIGISANSFFEMVKWRSHMFEQVNWQKGHIYSLSAIPKLGKSWIFIVQLHDGYWPEVGGSDGMSDLMWDLSVIIRGSSCRRG